MLGEHLNNPRKPSQANNRKSGCMISSLPPSRLVRASEKIDTASDLRRDIKMSTTIKRYSWIALISLLLACQVFSPQQAGHPTEVDPNAIYTQVAGTADVVLTQLAAITPTALPIA